MAVKSVFTTGEICDRPGFYSSNCDHKVHIGVVQKKHVFPKCKRCESDVKWTFVEDAKTLNSAEFVEGDPVEYDGEQHPLGKAGPWSEWHYFKTPPA